MNNVIESSSERFFEIYPNSQKCLYFVEFSRWPGKAFEYRLFKKNFIRSEEELEKDLLLCENDNERAWMRMQNECHPYQLLAGTVIEQPGVIAFGTIEFLKFTVDSLNKNTIEQ